MHGWHAGAAGTGSSAVPAGLAQVHLVAAGPQRRPLVPVVPQRPGLVALRRAAVGAQHPPPGDGAAVPGHHLPHLARAGRPDVLRPAAGSPDPPPPEAVPRLQDGRGVVGRVVGHEGYSPATSGRRVRNLESLPPATIRASPTPWSTR